MATTARTFYWRNTAHDMGYGTDVRSLNTSVDGSFSSTTSIQWTSTTVAEKLVDPNTANSNIAATEPNQTLYGCALNEDTPEPAMDSEINNRRYIPAGTWNVGVRIFAASAPATLTSYNIRATIVFRKNDGTAIGSIITNEVTRSALSNAPYALTGSDSFAQVVFEPGETLHTTIAIRSSATQALVLGGVTNTTITVSLGHAETFIQTPSPGIRTIYSRFPTENARATDTVSRKFIGKRTIIDLSPATNIVTRRIESNRSVEVNNAPADDTVTRRGEFQRASDVFEAPADDDTPVRVFEGHRTIVDLAPAQDDPVRRFTGSRMVTDLAPANDTVTRRGEFQRASDVFEAPAADDLERHYEGFRAIVDLAPADDTVTRQVVTARTIVDYAPADDTVTRRGEFQRVSDVFEAPADDTVERRVIFRRTLTDLAPADDDLERHYEGRRTITDYAPAVDVVSRVITYGRVIAEGPADIITFPLKEIIGVVYDTDGNPYEGAEVWLIRLSDDRHIRTTTSDVAGVFQFDRDLFDSQQYLVYGFTEIMGGQYADVSDRGLQVVDIGSVTPGGNLPGGNPNLYLAPQEVHGGGGIPDDIVTPGVKEIVGVVYDSEGDPYEGATVWLIRQLDNRLVKSTTSAVDGSFQFDRNADDTGTYTLYGFTDIMGVQHADVSDRDITVVDFGTVTPGDDLNGLNPNIYLLPQGIFYTSPPDDVTTPGVKEIVGVVYDSEGDPYEGAEVWLVRMSDNRLVQQTTSAVDGSFQFDRNSDDADEYILYGHDEILGVQNADISDRGITVVDVGTVTPGDDLNGLDPNIYLLPQGIFYAVPPDDVTTPGTKELVGVVYDVNGDPYEGADVWLLRLSDNRLVQSTTSAVDGSFQFDRNADDADTYAIYGYADILGVQHADVSERGLTVVDVGTVVPGGDLNGLNPNVYLAPQEIHYSLPPDDVTTPGTKEIVGVVYDPYGDPYEGATVWLARLSDNIMVKQTVSAVDGSFTFDRNADDTDTYVIYGYTLIGGTQHADVSDRGIEVVNVGSVIPGGDLNGLDPNIYLAPQEVHYTSPPDDVTTPGTKELTGVVYDIDGDPFQGATVWLTRLSDNRLVKFTTSDASGIWQFDRNADDSDTYLIYGHADILGVQHADVSDRGLTVVDVGSVIPGDDLNGLDPNLYLAPQDLHRPPTSAIQIATEVEGRIIDHLYVGSVDDEDIEGCVLEDPLHGVVEDTYQGYKPGTE